MYLVDTNFLGYLETHYPSDVFPSLWKRLEDVLFSSSVYFHEEVDAEMKRWAHPRLGWYLKHLDASQVLSPDQEELQAYESVTQWAVEHRPAYKPAAVDEFLNAADSWLVASALRYKATIVTNEVPAPESKKKVKIPDAAAPFGVPCITALDFLRVLNIAV